MNSAKSDSELVKETLQGELASFEIIVRRYEKMIYNHTYKILKNNEDAQDATQETFLRIFENLRLFDQQRPLKPWAYQIATNFCFDQLRKSSKVTALDMEVEEEGPTVLDKIIQKEEVRTLRAALFTLPEHYLRPLIGYYWANFSYRVIAETLNLPINTVRTRLRRGRVLLARQINANY